MASQEKVQSGGSSGEANERAAETVAPISTAAELEGAPRPTSTQRSLPPTAKSAPAGHDELVGQLKAAIAEAQRASGPSQEKFAGDVNLALRLLGETAPGRRAAEVLQGLLSKRKLAGLVASDGKSCRSAAVEQLLAMGFPFALEVTPEDLDHHRAQEQTLGKGATASLMMLAAFAVISPVVDMGMRAFENPEVIGTRSFALAVGILTALPAMLLLRARPAGRRAKWLRRILWAVGALGLLGGFLTQSFAAVPAGAAAVLAATLLKPRPEADAGYPPPAP